MFLTKKCSHPILFPSATHQLQSPCNQSPCDKLPMNFQSPINNQKRTTKNASSHKIPSLTSVRLLPLNSHLPKKRKLTFRIFKPTKSLFHVTCKAMILFIWERNTNKPFNRSQKTIAYGSMIFRFLTFIKPLQSRRPISRLIKLRA
jgi:hypothetical protein